MNHKFICQLGHFYLRATVHSFIYYTSVFICNYICRVQPDQTQTPVYAAGITAREMANDIKGTPREMNTVNCATERIMHGGQWQGWHWTLSTVSATEGIMQGCQWQRWHWTLSTVSATEGIMQGCQWQRWHLMQLGIIPWSFTAWATDDSATPA